MLLDLGVDLGAIGRGEDEAPGFAGHVRGGVGGLDAFDGLKRGEGGGEFRADDDNAGAGGEKSLGLSECDLAATDDEDGATVEVEEDGVGARRHKPTILARARWNCQRAGVGLEEPVQGGLGGAIGVVDFVDEAGADGKLPNLPFLTISHFAKNEPATTFAKFQRGDEARAFGKGEGEGKTDATGGDIPEEGPVGGSFT